MIRLYREGDWDDVWQILEPIFKDGETYAFSPDISPEGAHKAWVESPQECWVWEGDEGILGTYYLKPNQPALGAHVCNCGYAVDSRARGRGLASQMCVHSQQRGKDLGFRSMQYNLVASTNKGAVHLWKKHGFEIVGTLPGAFRSRSLGFVDAHIFFKKL